MSEITRRDLLERFFDLNTGRLHHFTLREYFGHVLDVEDVHFHHDSAVFLPDHDHPEVPAPAPAPPPAEGDAAEGTGEDTGEDDPAATRITGLAMLRSILLHASDHPARKLLIVGHTDTSGPMAYNLELSQLRADNVMHALLGNKDDWAAICEGKHKVRDYQRILTWVAQAWAVDCDPEGVDDKHGSNTDRAVKNFKTMYNEEFSASLDDTKGEVDLDTWKAFFDIYTEILADIMGVDVDQLGAARAKIKWLDDGKKTVGCGEHFPIDLPRVQGRRSASNRRVQVLFFDPGEEPNLDCHPAAGQCVPADCELYKKRIHFFWPIAPEPAPLLPRYKITLELGDIDKLMTPIVTEDHTDLGVRERLQAIGFLYSSLTHADIGARAQHAWDHFKDIAGTPANGAAVAELRNRVKNVIVDQGKIPAKGELGKIRVPGTWCVPPERAGFWGTNGSARHADETAIWLGNPSLGHIPIAAKVEAKIRRTFRVAGGVDVHFQFVTPDPIPAGHALAAEPLRATTTASNGNPNDGPRPPATVDFAMTGHPQKYLDDTKALKPAVAGDPFADNVHKDHGGKRGHAVRGLVPTENLFEVGFALAHYHTELALGTGTVSAHANAVKLTSNDAGLAVAIFMPSFTGGDRYKIRAFIDPLRGRASNGRERTAVFAETGTMVVWRILRISKYMRWDYPAGTPAAQQTRCGNALGDFAMGTISTEFKKAWLDVELEPKAQAATSITAAEHTAAIQHAKAVVSASPPGLTQRYDIDALILETGASAGVIEFRRAAAYDAAPKGPPPPGGWPRAATDASYWTNMAAIFQRLKTEFLDYFSKNAISGLTVIQAPAVANFLPDPPPGRPGTPWGNSGWGTDRRGCWVIFGMDVYNRPSFPYDHTRNCLHELGHVLYGVHQYTDTRHVNVNTGSIWDAHDYHDLCIMGYMKCDGGFCGRCVLSQAGWDTSTLLPNNPGP